MRLSSPKKTVPPAAWARSPGLAMRVLRTCAPAAPSLKSASVSRKVMALIRPALLVVLGVLLIAGGATVLDALFIVIGVIAIIAGIALVVPGAKEAFSAIGKSVSEGADDGETREEKDASSVEAGNAGASSADEMGEAKKESHDD